MHINYKSLRQYDHEVIPHMKRDTCIRVSSPQYLSLVHKHLEGKLTLIECSVTNDTQFPPNDQDIFS